MPYDEHDAERYVPEAAKRAGRTPFARDRARVLHCAALRRLSAKTQVLGPGVDDFVRNRLSHSLEVAQIGRELAGWLGCDPEIVDAACLAHDLGHPPFGHNGEAALNDIAAGIGGFEGNAQTFRVLTRLEGKSFTPDGHSAGLNLTRASLDAATKYPWGRDERPGTKFGYYADDAATYGWMRAGHAPGVRCIEAQVMDVADDVAYSVHDVEDGIVAGTLDLAAVTAEPAAYWEFVRRFSPRLADAELDAAWARLSRLASWPDGPFDGSRRALAGLKDLTSALIGRFVSEVTRATLAAAGRPTPTRYAADLVVPDDIAAEIALLKGLGIFHVTFDETAIAGRVDERDVLTALVTTLLRRPEALQPVYADDFAGAADDAARTRVVIDQVASLTDPDARTWLARLS